MPPAATTAGRKARAPVRVRPGGLALSPCVHAAPVTRCHALTTAGPPARGAVRTEPTGDVRSRTPAAETDPAPTTVARRGPGRATARTSERVQRRCAPAAPAIPK